MARIRTSTRSCLLAVHKQAVVPNKSSGDQRAEPQTRAEVVVRMAAAQAAGTSIAGVVAASTMHAPAAALPTTEPATQTAMASAAEPGDSSGAAAALVVHLFEPAASSSRDEYKHGGSRIKSMRMSMIMAISTSTRYSSVCHCQPIAPQMHICTVYSRVRHQVQQLNLSYYAFTTELIESARTSES